MSFIEFQSKLIDQAISKRNNIFTTTNALRLVNGKGDGFPGLTIDQYLRHFVIQLFHSKWETDLENISEYLQKHFPCEYIIAKWRESPDGRSLDQPKVKVLLNQSSSQTVVEEYGLKFNVDLNDTINTGLFLDMRENRRRLSECVEGKTVLNCFAYTCSFGVHAKAAGAKETINIDISRKVLDKGQENYKLNQLEVCPQEFLVRESGDYLSWCLKKDKRFDCIILDPPSFSRFEGKTISIQKDLPKMIDSAIKILSPKGVLFVSSNCSQISQLKLQNWLKEKAHAHRRRISEMNVLKQSHDFTGSGEMRESYLVGYLLKFFD